MASFRELVGMLDTLRRSAASGNMTRGGVLRSVSAGAAAGRVSVWAFERSRPGPWRAPPWAAASHDALRQVVL